MFNDIYTAAAIQPEFYTTVLLPQYFPAVIILQERIRPNLKEKYHLKPKDEAFLLDHHASGMPVIGVFDAQNQLVGAALLCDLNGKDNLAEYPSLPGAKQTIGVQMFMVDPDFQRRGLPKMLDAKALELFPEADFVAKVAADNKDSLKSFEGRGYAIIKTKPSYDPASGRNYIAHYLIKVNEACKADMLPRVTARGGQDRAFALK